MSEESREPENMIDFIVSRLDAEDQQVAEMIRPLPENVVPSAQFVQRTRLQLLTVTASESADRRAA